MTGAIDKAVSPLSFETSSSDAKKLVNPSHDSEEFSDVFEQANAHKTEERSNAKNDDAHSLSDSINHHDPERSQAENSQIIGDGEALDEQSLSEIRSLLTDSTASQPNGLVNSPLSVSGLNLAVYTVNADGSLVASINPEAAGTNPTASLVAGLSLNSGQVKLSESQLKPLNPLDTQIRTAVTNNPINLSNSASLKDYALADVSADLVELGQNLSKLTTAETVNTPLKADFLSALAAVQAGDRSGALNSNLVASLPVTHSGWGEQIGQKVLYMASQGLLEAEIQLDPPELGPLQARVSINNDQAQVTFNSHSSQVRDALEQSVSRLRELLSGEGIDLVNVNVSDNPHQQQRQNADANELGVTDRELSADEDAVLESTTSEPEKVSQYIVDDYI